MPYGELRFSRNALLIAAPLPLSRNKVMRFALGHSCAGVILHHLVGEPLHALAVVRPGRRVGFGDQHVAIRQHVEPARMIELGRKSGDLETVRRQWACAPGASPLHSQHGRSGSASVGRGDRRRRTFGGRLRELGAIAAEVENSRNPCGNDDENGNRQDNNTSTHGNLTRTGTGPQRETSVVQDRFRLAALNWPAFAAGAAQGADADLRRMRTSNVWGLHRRPTAGSGICALVRPSGPRPSGPRPSGPRPRGGAA